MSESFIVSSFSFVHNLNWKRFESKFPIYFLKIIKIRGHTLAWLLFLQRQLLRRYPQPIALGPLQVFFLFLLLGLWGIRLGSLGPFKFSSSDGLYIQQFYFSAFSIAPLPLLWGSVYYSRNLVLISCNIFQSAFWLPF